MPFFQANNLIDEPKAQRLYAHRINLPSVDCSSLHCILPHETEITPGTVKTGYCENIAHQPCSCKSFTKKMADINHPQICNVLPILELLQKKQKEKKVSISLSSRRPRILN